MSARLWNRALLVVFVAGLHSPAVRAGIPSDERAALIALYVSTQGAGWTDRTNWLNGDGTGFNDPGTECTWYGVTCDDGQAVKRIRLRSNNLVGTIPSILADLTELSRLDLYGNELSGPIPPELSLIVGLDLLNLSHNFLTGPIPAELGELRGLWSLDLSFNDLSGIIPPELSELDSLGELNLQKNRLSGPVPSTLGFLSEAWQIRLSWNELTGTIPPELGSIPKLQRLWLSFNHLSGPIPAELGDLASLNSLGLHGNMLSGPIPSELVGLTRMPYWHGIYLCHNAVYSDDPVVLDFLGDALSPTCGLDTQTLAPESLSVEFVHDRTVWLAWDAVAYLEDPGGYEVFYAPAGTDLWVSAGWTWDKLTAGFPVTDLDPGTAYEFTVASFTEPHEDNQNLVMSEIGPSVMTTTTDFGCEPPAITMTGGSPASLSVDPSYVSFLWSTGETTASIEVAPPSARWYWVNVTGPGSCEEAATVYVDPEVVFRDGFESADTALWSLTVEGP